MNTYPIFLSIITFLSTLSGGLFAVKYRKKMGVLIAFVAGVLIAVALIGLLPEVIGIAEEFHIPVYNVMSATVLGFVFLWFMDRYYSVRRVCEDNVCRYIHNPKGGFFGALELSADSFIDGVTIGVCFQFSFSIGMIFAIAIIADDFSDGINTVTVMLNSGNSLMSSIRMLLIDAIAPVLGVISTFFIVIPKQYIVFIVPFFAGGILYMGASDLLPKSYEENPLSVSLLYGLLGIILVFILTRVI